jgi:hypothetical protein
LSGREGFGVLSPSHRACERVGKIKCLFSIVPDARTGGEVTEVVVAVLQETDTGRGGDRRWPCVCRLIPGTVSRGGGDGRVDAHATDAGVSVCRSVFGGLASTRASDAEPCLSIDRQTRLSWLSGAWEHSGPHLSRDKCWSGLTSDASDTGSRPLVFERAVDTWRRLRATYARVASVGLATDASIAPEISLVNC